MTESVLARLFEHNNWANLLLLDACSRLTDAQLDAPPRSVTKGSIRRTLEHLVDSQQYYFRLLTGVEPRFNLKGTRSFPDLQAAATISGEAFLAVARDEASQLPRAPRQTTDGYLVEPWVIMLQVINHATEHREQISSMLTDLGITPPDMDGWSYAGAVKAMLPISA